MYRTLPRVRRAYTIVELLVVISIIIVLAAIVVAVANSGAFGSQRVVSASDRVGGWLKISKNRAVRDGAPRGLRFMLTPATATRQEFVGHVTEMMYIEQPEIWNPNPTQEPSGASLVFATVTVPNPTFTTPANLVPGAVLEQWCYFITNSQDTLNEFDTRVSVGDFVVLPEHNNQYKISAILHPDPTLSLPSGTSLLLRPVELFGVTPPIGMTGSSLYVRQLVLVTSPYKAFDLGTHYQAWERPEPDLGASGLPLDTANQPSTPVGPFNTPYPRRATKATHNFGFQAAPRPILGEPILTLTANTIIDVRSPLPVTTPATYINLGPNGYRDWGTAPITTAPYWPTTSIGFQLQSDALGQTYFDIVFSPSGQVINTTSNLIALWVRDPEKVQHPRLGDAPANNRLPTVAQWTTPLPTQLDRLAEFDAAGEQLLVVIYPKTGMIANHPIVPPPATPTVGYDPYRFAKDGANSGF